MHPNYARRRALKLVAGGMNDCQVARATGIPRSTVREMRLRAERPAGSRSLTEAPACPRCWQPARTIRLSGADYAELLGLYLGDGYIARTGRTYRLRLFLDSKYGQIVADAEALLRRGFVDNAVRRQLVHRGTMTVLSVYSKHLPCLFPQLGPGPKHEREILLEPWQAAIVDAEPWPLLRGLIRSDGCSFVNRTGPHEYLSFQFANRSTGIARIFEAACGRVGVLYRSNFNRRRKIWDIRINRRSSVALMREHVGVKR